MGPKQALFNWPQFFYVKYLFIECVWSKVDIFSIVAKYSICNSIFSNILRVLLQLLPIFLVAWNHVKQLHGGGNAGRKCFNETRSSQLSPRSKFPPSRFNLKKNTMCKVPKRYWKFHLNPWKILLLKSLILWIIGFVIN